MADRTKMAISNSLFSITLKITAEFPTWFVPIKLSTNPCNYSQPRRQQSLKNSSLYGFALNLENVTFLGNSGQI